MPEGYLVTKPNGDRYAVLKSKAMTNQLQLHNSRCREDERYKYVTMDEAEAEALIAREGVRDNSHSPIPKVMMQQNVIKSQQSEIEELRAQIEALSIVAKNAIAQEPVTEQLNVVKTLEKLNSLTTVDEVNELLVGEERATIINAANKLIKTLS